MFYRRRYRPLLPLAVIAAMFLLASPIIAACATPTALFASTDTPGTVDGVEFGAEDILSFFGTVWELYFDGSEYGLQPGKHDIEAFSVWQPITDTREIYISFYQNKVKVDGVGAVMGQDVIKFTEIISPSASYSYELFFDGSDVGLSTVGEKIDGLEVFPFPMDDCMAVLGISTLGQYSIPAKFTGGAGKLTGDGSDVLLFCATNLGEDTAGLWSKFFDGREKEMSKNYLDSLSLISPSPYEVIFTTPGAFALDEALGGHSDVYLYDGEQFFGPDFSAADEDLTEFVDGLHVFYVSDWCSLPLPIPIC